MVPPQSETDRCRNFSSASRKGLTRFGPVPEMLAETESPLLKGLKAILSAPAAARLDIRIK
ncbi:MAG TPA: hypothetical protein PLM24_03085 [Methanothrix sp.]|nr:hypothetical protein [Methanothrix sp.]HPJ84208.1 hypothetical protein [Methanothrix sp.]HPR66100.1 hypothetical protein [Methanothrix sp.]